jgi:GT2 family glycosyltransferase
MKKSSVLISILNWNNAEKTLECIESLTDDYDICPFDVRILVIDNGSGANDYKMLSDARLHNSVEILRLEKNLGFTGGHNIAIEMAIKQNVDFIWLLNNDAKIVSGALAKLVSAIAVDAGCAAVSPVLRPLPGESPIAAWGAIHDWAGRSVEWARTEEESRIWHTERPGEICVAGTALLLRVTAIAATGGLDDRLFAYFDDSDLGVRLARAGWRSKVVFDAEVVHPWRQLPEQPAYFFYLMFRNELIFWTTNTPASFRRLLYLKLLNQALFNAIRLRRKHMVPQSNAALLGIWDYLRGRNGAPDVHRRVPLIMKIFSLVGTWLNSSALRKVM